MTAFANISGVTSRLSDKSISSSRSTSTRFQSVLDALEEEDLFVRRSGGDALHLNQQDSNLPRRIAQFPVEHREMKRHVIAENLERRFGGGRAWEKCAKPRLHVRARRLQAPELLSNLSHVNER